MAETGMILGCEIKGKHFVDMYNSFSMYICCKPELQ
jgi:hypothetical protein